MESINKYIRQLQFTFNEAYTNFIRSGWMAWIVITTMTASMTVFGAFIMILQDISFMSNSVASRVQIVAFLKQDAMMEKTQAQVSTIEGVTKVEMISKDKAWQELKKELKNSMEFENIKNQNPLPDTLQITIKNPKEIDDVAKRIKNNSDIESVKYNKELADYIIQAARIVRLIGTIITLLFGFATLAIIVNTIRLAVNSRRNEIEIMRLVGATNWFIRLPFLLEGIIFGFVSAILTSILLVVWRTFSLSQIKLFLPFIPIEEQPSFLNDIIMLTVLVSVLVGFSGSAFSVTRYLKFEKANTKEE
ncbi:MAG: permease-like cell division protein FtsX [Candidatus Sericytochromatia bacterium]